MTSIDGRPCGCPPGECRDPAADPDRWALRQHFAAAGIPVCEGPRPAPEHTPPPNTDTPPPPDATITPLTEEVAVLLHDRLHRGSWRAWPDLETEERGEYLIAAAAVLAHIFD